MIRGYATFITRKVDKYNNLIFGKGVLDALKLGNKYYDRRKKKIIRDKFKVYIGIEYYLILNDITPEYLLENINTEYSFLKYEHYDKQHFLKNMDYKLDPELPEMLKAMVQQKKKADFTPIMNPRDEEKMVLS